MIQEGTTSCHMDGDQGCISTILVLIPLPRRALLITGRFSRSGGLKKHPNESIYADQWTSKKSLIIGAWRTEHAMYRPDIVPPVGRKLTQTRSS